MTALAVIGGMYGDEGKGLMVDYLTRIHRVKTVTRFNGGSQCSHTVNVGHDRHVFQTYSAGTFAGANTYLGAHVVLNPYVFDKEYRSLGSRTPKLTAYTQVRITTLFDMLLANAAELQRGQAKHGSCGIGMHETIYREDVIKLRLYDVLCDYVSLGKKLQHIHQTWVPARLQQLFGTAQRQPWMGPMFDILFDTCDYDDMAMVMRRCLAPIRMANLNVLNDLADEKYHILEGAQGLGLDEELGVMPHCTHSKTGLPQAISTAQYELAQTGVQPIYVTRCYTTRHGAGPLHGEGSFITDAKLYDETNQPNPWQDTIRFAPLDLQLLSSHIKRDLARVNYHGVAQLALTCLDQLGTNVTVYDIDGKLQTISSSILPSFVQQQMAPVARLKYIARGPRARDVTQLRS